MSCGHGFIYGEWRFDPQVHVYFKNYCDEDIRCGKLEVLNDTGEVIWEGGGVVVHVEPRNWPYDHLATCFLPSGGDYEVVLQADLGEFRKKSTIEYR